MPTSDMPSSFKYKDVFIKGRPQHYGWDEFTIKHPPMPASRWAKIFAPFDALKGFNEAIAVSEEELLNAESTIPTNPKKA